MSRNKIKWELVTSKPVEPPYVPDDVGWTCYDCGSTGPFTRDHNYSCGTSCDCDVECLECGSVNGGEEIQNYKENPDATT